LTRWRSLGGKKPKEGSSAKSKKRRNGRGTGDRTTGKAIKKVEGKY